MHVTLLVWFDGSLYAAFALRAWIFRAKVDCPVSKLAYLSLSVVNSFLICVETLLSRYFWRRYDSDSLALQSELSPELSWRDLILFFVKCMESLSSSQSLMLTSLLLASTLGLASSFRRVGESLWIFLDALDVLFDRKQSLCWILDSRSVSSVRLFFNGIE
jgi:hypothetical protein